MLTLRETVGTDWAAVAHPQAKQKRRHRLRVAFLFAAVATYVGCLCVVVAHRRGVAAFGKASEVDEGHGSAPGGNEPVFNVSLGGNGASSGVGKSCVFELPDLGFDWVPHFKAPEITEFWVLLGIMITVLRFLFSAMGHTVLRRWLLVAGMLSIVRGLSRMLTVRPVPGSRCPFEDDLSMSAPWVALLVFARQASTCADVLFSFHVVNLTLCAMVWLYYAHTTNLGVHPSTARRAVLAYLAVGYWLIVATRAHYTTDLFLWAVLTSLSWAAYHQWAILVRLDHLQLLGGPRFVGLHPLVMLTRYLEDGAEDLDFAVRREDEHARDDSVHRAVARADSFEDDPEFDRAFETSEETRAVFEKRQRSARLGGPKSPNTGYESFTPLD